jgi:hypothetical protein
MYLIREIFQVILGKAAELTIIGHQKNMKTIINQWDYYLLDEKKVLQYPRLTLF